MMIVFFNMRRHQRPQTSAKSYYTYSLHIFLQFLRLFVCISILTVDCWCFVILAALYAGAELDMCKIQKSEREREKKIVISDGLCQWTHGKLFRIWWNIQLKSKCLLLLFCCCWFYWIQKPDWNAISELIWYIIRCRKYLLRIHKYSPLGLSMDIDP